MAEPVTTTIAIKQAITFVLTEPEKAIKFIFYGVIIPLITLLLLFVIPIILIVSIPILLFNSGNATDVEKLEQMEHIAMYQEAPVIISNEESDWIDNKKEEYNWCDEFQVTYNFDLTWQHLMTLDAVRFNQNFTNITRDKVLALGRRFIISKFDIESYQEQRIYYVSGIRMVEMLTRNIAIIDISTKSFDDMLEELSFDNLQIDMAKNILNTIINTDVEGNFNIYDDVDILDLEEYPPGNANIPYFNQGDKRWGAYSYGRVGSIKSSGCGPTCLSMVVAGLTNRSDINPKSVADWSVSNGHRAEGAGSYWSLMTAGGENYGLRVESVSRKNPNKIIKALSDGYPVIASMGRGHFTNGGHFIVLRGIDSNGKILVHDPASLERSQQAWNIGVIMNESSTNGGVNGSPFWIYKH